MEMARLLDCTRRTRLTDYPSDIFEQMRAYGFPEFDAIEVARRLDRGPGWLPAVSSDALLECAESLPFLWNEDSWYFQWPVCTSTEYGFYFNKLYPSGAVLEIAVYERSSSVSDWELVAFDQFSGGPCEVFESLTSGRASDQITEAEFSGDYVRMRPRNGANAVAVANSYFEMQLSEADCQKLFSAMPMAIRFAGASVILADPALRAPFQVELTRLLDTLTFPHPPSGTSDSRTPIGRLAPWARRPGHW